MAYISALFPSCMFNMLCCFIHYLNRQLLWNEHELIRVFVTANVTIHKRVKNSPDGQLNRRPQIGKGSFALLSCEIKARCCGWVGRAVASDARGPWFKYSQRQYLCWTLTVNCSEKTKIEAENGQIKKVVKSILLYTSYLHGAWVHSPCTIFHRWQRWSWYRVGNVVPVQQVVGSDVGVYKFGQGNPEVTLHRRRKFERGYDWPSWYAPSLVDNRNT